MYNSEEERLELTGVIKKYLKRELICYDDKGWSDLVPKNSFLL